MDSWKLDFDYDVSPADDKLIAIYIKMPDIFNIDGWEEAIVSEGKKPLFTCSCGDFGCGGYFIEVIQLTHIK